jgi:hypothetical protein
MAVRRQENSVSLFPFLAVLVCAMGALILLLLVTTRQIRKTRAREAVIAGPVLPDAAEVPAAEIDTTADQAMAAAQADKLETLYSAIDETETQIALLQEQLAFQRGDLAEREERLAALRGDVTECEQKVAELKDADASESLAAAELKLASEQSEVEELERSLNDKQQELEDKYALLLRQEDEAERQERKLTAARSALISLRGDVAAANQQQEEFASGATVVEFSNPSGTAQNPILLDVTGDGFRLMTSGIQISPRDMEGASVSDNALLSAVLTAHEFRSGGSVVSQPYVLMLVRPSGSVPFYMAQRILTQAGVHFGYELVDEERRIAFGGVDRDETRVVRDAVLESISNRDRRYATRRDLTQRLVDGRDGNTRGIELKPDGRVVIRGPGYEPAAEATEQRGRLRPPVVTPGQQEPRRIADLSERQFPARSPRMQPDGSRSDDDQSAAADVGSGQINLRSVPAGQQWAGGPGAAAVHDLPTEKWPTATAQGPGGERSESELLPAVSPDAEWMSELPRQSSRKGPADVAPSALANLPPQGQSQPDRYSQTLNDLQQEATRADQPPWTGADQTDAAPPQQLADATPSTSGFSAAENNQQSSSTFRGTMAGEPSWMQPPGDIGELPQIPPELADTDLRNLDPELLKYLKNRKTDTGSDISRPVGVTVFVDPQHMTVGQRDAVFVTREGELKAVNELFNGITEAVEASQTSPLEPVLPIVKFVVSPGGEMLRARLADQLTAAGVPFATVVSIEPYIKPVSGVATFSAEQPPSETPPRETKRPTPRRPIKSTGLERELR